MASSTFYQQPDLNDNYLPLLGEHPLLQFYFKESFALMDKSVQPIQLLSQLLDHYLGLPSLNRVGRVVKQHALVEQMQLKLKTLPAPVNIKQAFQLLNESVETIHPDDDLIKLLSAYCSIFPYINRELTNSHIINALTIRDINNIYFHTIVERWLAWKSELGALFSNKETISIAFLTNQYPSFLRKQMRDLMSVSKRQAILSHSMKTLVKYATIDEVENIILMPVMTYLNSDDDQYAILKHSLPHILGKVSDQMLETKILPELLKLLNQKYSETVSQLLLVCIKRMSADSLRQVVLPILQSYFFSESKETVYDSYKQFSVIKPFLLLLSRLSKDENNRIAEQLVPRLKPDWFDNILNFLNKLQKDNLYVSENLFQAISHKVSQVIDEALSDLKKNGYNPVYPKNLNARQIKTYFTTFSFEDAYKTHRETLLKVLQDFTKLPEDVYPKTMRAKVLRFLWNHRAAQDSSDRRYVSAVVSYLKAHDWTGSHSRKFLLDMCDYAIQKIKEVDFDLDLWGMRSQLLETCASLMSEQEIVDHIVPMIDIKELDVDNLRYLAVMGPIFKQVFAKINNTLLSGRFFDSFLLCYLRNPYMADCKELLPLLIEKLDPVSQVYACRRLLKQERLDFEKESVVNVFAWFYKHNSETLGLPGFCNAHLQPSIELSNSIEGKRAWSLKCSLM